MFTALLTRAIRRRLVGPEQRFSFQAAKNIDPGPLERTGLYIHIPFCKNLCPYCPYNKIRYERKLAGPYLQALLEEVEQYYNRIGKAEITSIYIGGGTPTNLIDELGTVLSRIRERFHLVGDICIETNPEDITGKTLISCFNAGLIWSAWAGRALTTAIWSCSAGVMMPLSWNALSNWSLPPASSRSTST